MDDLAPKRAVTNATEARFQRIEYLGLAKIRKLVPKALQVAKNVLVNEADETKKFQK